MKPPYAIGSVPSLSGHAIAYRWRPLPRVRRHRASKPQGSSERVLPWQDTMDQLIFASLSHTHYWYEVGMLKVPSWHRRVLLLLILGDVNWVSQQKARNTLQASRDFIYFLPTSSGGGGGGGMLPDFLFCSLFPVQQTTSGIGHRVK